MHDGYSVQFNAWWLFGTMQRMMVYRDNSMHDCLSGQFNAFIFECTLKKDTKHDETLTV